MFGGFDIFRDGASGNNYVAFLLHDRVSFHSVEDAAAHGPDLCNAVRSVSYKNIDSSMTHCGMSTDFDCPVLFLRRRGIIHDEEDGVAVFDREFSVEGALHNVQKLSLQKLNGSGDIRKCQDVGNHVRAFLQTVKRNDQSAGIFWRGKEF